MSKAKLSYGGLELELPMVLGTEGERAIDITQLREQSGLCTYDPGFANTAACTSSITFIDGERGVLRYRGYSIEEVAQRLSFERVCYLLLEGKLAAEDEQRSFEAELARLARPDPRLVAMLECFDEGTQPMAALAAVVAAMDAVYPGDSADTAALRVLAQSNVLVARWYRHINQLSPVEAPSGVGYAAALLRMMFDRSETEREQRELEAKALDQLLVLHADHEQNCSTSTVRMVASSQATLYAALAAGIGALSGPLHGGANLAVIEMLESLLAERVGLAQFLERVKRRERRLMGFGHRVYKNVDPRATAIETTARELFAQQGRDEPLLELATQLRELALEDEYFQSRRLYPNVDFFSGIIYRALGFPAPMFPVLFALGRMPGWIAHFRELRGGPFRIQRPRQVYVGEGQRAL